MLGVGVLTGVVLTGVDSDEEADVSVISLPFESVIGLLGVGSVVPPFDVVVLSLPGVSDPPIGGVSDVGSGVLGGVGEVGGVFPGGIISIENSLEADPPGPVTVAVKVKRPSCVGVPLILPFGERVIPGGNEPPVTDHVSG